MDASFVIPCFRSSEPLIQLVTELAESARKSLDSFEILLVRDSSDSQTAGILNWLEQQYSETRQIKLTRNFGQQSATVAGIVRSSGDIIVTLDDDYQHKPTDAIALVELCQNDAEVQLVYARPLASQASVGVQTTGRLFRSALRLSGLSFADSVSSFRAFRGYLRNAFLATTGPNVAVDIVLSWVVDKVATFECEFRPRKNGASGYSNKSRLKLALSILLVHTTKPLQTGIYFGFTGVSISLIWAVVSFSGFLEGSYDSARVGISSLLVLFMGSLQLVVLGILGLYIGEQHKFVTQRPAFLERSD